VLTDISHAHQQRLLLRICNVAACAFTQQRSSTNQTASQPRSDTTTKHHPPGQAAGSLAELFDQPLEGGLPLLVGDGAHQHALHRHQALRAQVLRHLPQIGM
jgi:hypothetical protein